MSVIQPPASAAKKQNPAADFVCGRGAGPFKKYRPVSENCLLANRILFFEPTTKERGCCHCPKKAVKIAARFPARRGGFTNTGIHFRKSGIRARPTEDQIKLFPHRRRRQTVEKLT